MRFDEIIIIPDNECYLTDNSIETCSMFNISIDAPVPIRTKFRIQLPSYVEGRVNVSLIGTNIRCDNSFFVTPLSEAETERWTGHWTTCPLRGTSIIGEKESCFYECRCSGGCEEIQIIRMPSSVVDSSWSLCDVSMTYLGM